MRILLAKGTSSIGSVRANFKQLYLHTHWKLDTCLYELIYLEQSILPPPKIFTILLETPCVLAFEIQREVRFFLLIRAILLCLIIQWVIYSVEINRYIQFIKVQKTDVLLVTCKEVGLQIYADTTKCMFVSCEQNVGQDDNINSANNKSYWTINKVS
jgi:hypothetical protein